MQNKFRPIATTLTLGAVAFGAGQAAAQSTGTSPEELASRITALENERSGPIRLGANTTLDIYGFIQVDFFQDLDADQGDFTNAASAGTNDNGEFDSSVRVSRIGFRTTTQSSFGEIGTQLEFDLIGNGGNDFNAEPRIRHANVTIGDSLLIGQFWSNFMPIGQYPTTVDFNGPVGIAFRRAPQIRYTNTLGEAFTYSVSLEEGETQGTLRAQTPRATAAFNYATDLFTARAAVLYGELEEETTGETFEQSGIVLSGSVNPWAGGQFTGTYTSGQALGSLFIGGADNVVGGEENDFDAFTVEFRQDIGEKLNVGVVYGREDYDLTTNIGDANEFNELEGLFLNAFYTPVENFAVGFEYAQVTRTNASDVEFDADRVAINFRYSF